MRGQAGTRARSLAFMPGHDATPCCCSSCCLTSLTVADSGSCKE